MEGDRWRAQLIVPALERLLALQAGEQVLDLGAATGGWPAG